MGDPCFCPCSKSFIDEVKKSLGFKAKGKSITESKGHYQLREDVSNFGKTSTNGFEPAAGADAEMTNTFFWDDKS